MISFQTVPDLDFDVDIASVKRTKAEARDFYNDISRYYDTLATSSEKKYINAGLDMLTVQEGEHVLEIGIGTGHALAHIAQNTGKSGHAYGVDIAEGMIQISREKMRDFGLSNKTSLVINDASQLPFQSSTMDAIFISFTLELFHTPEIPQVLEECRRVLKNQGRLGVVSLSKDDPLTFFGKIYEWLHKRFPKTLDCRPIPVQTFLTHAGFAIQDHKKEIMWGLPVGITLAAAAK